MENTFSVEFTTLFLQLYKELEEIEDKYPARFETYKIYHQGQIDGFRTLRNLLSHNQSNNMYPAIVSESYLNEIKDVIRRLKTKAIDICTKKEFLFAANENDSLYKIINKMNESNYSYVPILDSNGLIKYVVTGKSIITILANSKEGMIYDSSILVKDYLDYFDINKNPNERFIYVSKDDYASDIEAELGKMINKKITSVAFVTANGKPTEKILGMINAWNLLNF